MNRRPRSFLSAREQVPRLYAAENGFNVVLTHCTADFDSLASAVGLAKLWSNEQPSTVSHNSDSNSSSSIIYPTFVVLPRGCHPSVQKFLALHEHLFPIRSLRSLPADLSKLNRLGLVDAQRRERVGPAEFLLSQAKRVTIVDHHVDGESDITEATDYIVDRVGSVSTMICEFLDKASIDLSEAEATLLALGIHADTGSLCYDSTTARDAKALAWVMEQGASQSAIAEHVRTSLSQEQQKH
jgi:tRNA nucleotidyltransferase (CCA-adding enzyme)